MDIILNMTISNINIVLEKKKVYKFNWMNFLKKKLYKNRVLRFLLIIYK
jgi:hypothetical protein